MIQSVHPVRSSITRASGSPAALAPPGSQAEVFTPSGSSPILAQPGPAEQSSGRNWGRVGRIAAVVALGLVGVGFLAGCGSSAAPPQACVSGNYQAADLSFEVIPIEAPRVDVYRATHSEVEKGPDGTEVTRSVPNEYSPFGVYLGDGLFYDFNGNLTMVPQRLAAGPLVPQDATRITVDPTGFNNTTDVTRRGDRVNVDPPGWGNSTDVVKDGCQVRINPTGWYNEIVIERNGNRTVINPYGLANEIHLNRSQGQVSVDPYGWNNEVGISLGDGRANVDPFGWNNDTGISWENGNV
ncbi:MAG: hypothetical protein AB1758_32375, partial [Candidatus Eremiobacterota bacterium]